MAQIVAGESWPSLALTQPPVTGGHVFYRAVASPFLYAFLYRRSTRGMRARSWLSICPICAVGQHLRPPTRANLWRQMRLYLALTRSFDLTLSLDCTRVASPAILPHLAESLF
jgi:hypothetical protein